MSEATRAWIYRGIFILAFVGLIVGIVSEEQIIAAVNAAAALASSGLASLNTSTKTLNTSTKTEG